MTALHYRDAPHQQTYFFNRHQARLTPAPYGPTASYDVQDYGYIILLCQAPLTLPDALSPGDYTGSCFHYGGDFCIPEGREIPTASVISAVVHDLLNFEISMNTIRSLLVDAGHGRYNSQVTSAQEQEQTERGVVIRFLISFRVVEDALLHYNLELAAIMEDATKKLADIGKAKQAAATAAGQVIGTVASLETKH